MKVDYTKIFKIPIGSSIIYPYKIKINNNYYENNSIIGQLAYSYDSNCFYFLSNSAYLDGAVIRGIKNPYKYSYGFFTNAPWNTWDMQYVNIIDIENFKKLKII